MSDTPHPNAPFDRDLVRRHRDRAAPMLDQADFLLRHGAALLADRLHDTTRTFQYAVDLGCHGGEVGADLPAGKVAWMAAFDPAIAMARRVHGGADTAAAVADEDLLPLADGSVDLVLSNLSLHWVNDLPGALIQINRALKPDGLFVATLFGGTTLVELREVLTETESRLAGGASPRISPMVGLRDAAGLLQRAGFALPVADVETVTVTYPDLFALVRDLRAMGETAAHGYRTRRPTTREFWMEAGAVYRDRFSDADGRLEATFQIITLTGWAPGPGQPRPKRPGSATARLADALGTDEEVLPSG